MAAQTTTGPESTRNGKLTTFGDVLRREREVQGLSHRDLAARCGVARDVPRSWERGEATPSGFQVKKLIGSMRSLRYFVHLLPKSVYDETARLEPLPTQAQPDTVAPQPPAKSFAEALRRARVREGFAQDEIAELIGVSAQAVSAWETEVNTPVVPNWDALLDLFPELASYRPSKMKNREKPDGGAGLERAAAEPTRVGSGAMWTADLFRVCARASYGEDTFYVAVPKVGDAQHVFAAAVLTATEANAERQQANTRTREIRSVERFGDVFIEAKSS